MGTYIHLVQALKQPFISAALGHPTMFPDMPAKSCDTKGTFLKFHIMHSPPTGAELGTGCESFTGILQIDIFTKAESGDAPSYEIAEQLQDVYPRGRLSNGTIIQSSGISNSGPDNVYGPKYKVVYSVAFEYFGNPRIPQVAPSFVLPPQITGYAEPYNRLTSTTGVAEGTAPIDYTLQWYRNGVIMVGATGTFYDQIWSDIGAVFTTVATATNQYGSKQSDSNAVATIDPYVGPLDVLQTEGYGVAAAYAAQALSKTYEGKTVLTLNDALAEQLIGTVEHHFDAVAFDAFAPTGGGARALIDQSGEDVECIQTTDAKVAPIIADAVNGRYGFDMDGLPSWEMNGIDEAPNDWSFFFVADTNGQPLSNTVLFESVLGRIILFATAQYASTTGYGFREGGDYSISGKISNNKNLIEVIFNSTDNTSRIAVNRYDQTVGNYGTQLALSGETSLGSSYNEDPASAVKLKLGAFIATRGACTELVRSKVRQAFAEYYTNMTKEVILFTGQSNLQGADALGNHTPLPAMGQSFAYNFDTDVMDLVSDPMPNSGDTIAVPAASSSPVPMFCQTLNTLGVPFAPVVAERAVSGTTEVHHSNPNWSASSTLAQESVDAANAACVRARTAQPKAIIRLLGETDVLNIDAGHYTAQAYEDALRANLLAYRAEWDQVIVVIGQTTWRGGAGDTAGAIAVRAAQQKMADDYAWVFISTVSESFHGNGWILNDGGAWVHWTWEACNASGKDIAHVLNAAIGGSVPYKGVGDAVVANAEIANSSQRMYDDWEGDHSEVNANAVISSIGFEDDLFDEDTWDVVSADGVHDVWEVVSNDQSGNGRTAANATPSNRPLLGRLGVLDFIGTNSWLEAISLAPTTKLSGYVVMRGKNLATFDQGMIAQDTITGDRMFAFTHKKGGSGLLEASIFSGAVYQPVTCPMPSADYEDRGVGVGFSYDSVTGLSLYIDGLPQITTGTASGMIDSGTADLVVGALSSGFWKFEGQIDTYALWFATLSDKDHLALHTTYMENQKIHIFMIAGQSNANGHPPDTATVPPPVVPTGHGYYFDGTDRLPYVSPVGEEEFGSAWGAFCNQYYALTGYRAVIVFGATDGSGMTVETQGTNNWSATGDAYTKFVDQVTDVERVTGHKVKGVLWSQGESYSYNRASGPDTSTPAIYEAGFNDLLDRLDILIPGSAFFIAKMGNYLLPQSAPYDEEVRVIQDKMAAERANVHIGFSGAINFDPNVHYKQAELNSMGEGMAVTAASELVS